MRERVVQLGKAEIGRKRPEGGRAKRGEQYWAIFDSMTAKIWYFDLEGRIVRVNRIVAHSLGLPVKDIVGKTLFDCFSPDQAARLAADNRKVILSGKAKLKVIELHVLSTGEKRWTETDKIPYYDKKGEIAGVIIFGTDITERQRAEEALHASQLQLSEAMDLARIVYWELDCATQVFTFNDPFYAFLATTAEREGGYRMPAAEYSERFVHPDDRAVVKRSAENNRLGTDSEFLVDVEHRIIRRDGEIRHILARTRGFRDAMGRIVRCYGANQDITDRKRGEEKLESTLGNLRKAIGGTVQAIALVLEARDPYTAGHQRRVADLARSIATEMRLPSDMIEGIRMAAVIHDIGKISVPAEMLSKPGKLTEREFGFIAEHSRAGYEILKDVEFPWPVAEIIYQHHERLDGSGYPRGLKGDDVLVEARIIALADVIEAMASHRPYRPARGVDAALHEIKKNKGILYDPRVVDACLKLFEEKGYTFD
jgi:PAS domain S-box-containing protein/putative nucleotidyltransferase with HDIG domain